MKKKYVFCLILIAVMLISSCGPIAVVPEQTQGPTAAAIGNALASATGHRLRDLPLTRDKIRAVFGA